jgi:uncharacterized caspase-like protein
MSTFFRHAARILCALIIATLSAEAAMAGQRVALVIGNAKYEHADTLVNTVNDANAIASMLTRAGFDVVNVQRNVGVVEFKRAVREFVNSSANADIAVVYYSGHGIEIGGINYLIPVDAKLANTSDIEDEAIALDRVIQATQAAKNLSLIILDACRDNPFLHAAQTVATSRSPGSRATTTTVAGNRLVGVQPASSSTLIAYAAKAGAVSFDGAGSNSPFTTALVKYLAEPGLDIRIALGKVRDDVLASTGNQQEPFVYGSIGGADISLVPAPAVPKVEPAPAVADPNVAAAQDYELAERVGVRQVWESFLAVHNSGFYADLARAQLAKLTGAEPPKSPDSAKEAKDAKEQADRLATIKRKDDEHAQQEAIRVTAQQDAARLAAQKEAARVVAQREAALLPRADVASAPALRIEAAPSPAPRAEAAPAATPAALTPDQLCKRDETRLARLRADPSADGVAQFARELACQDLRPQVQRLAESLGVAPIATTQTASLVAASAAAPAAIASPTATPSDSASQSKGVAQEKVVELQRRAEAETSVPTAAPPAEIAQACKRDADELARIRANPDRPSALRFTKNLKCEDLRAQAARLLESIGD